MTLRFAEKNDLERVNELRRQVNELHVEGKPEVFKPGFSDELRDHVNTVFSDPDKRILVCEKGGVICGFAVLARVVKPENPYMFERRYLDIDELCVDCAYRRKGVATEMMEFIREYAKAEGYDRVELNMWEFNREALEFYEKVGFTTYRRYMEMKV